MVILNNKYSPLVIRIGKDTLTFSAENNVIAEIVINEVTLSAWEPPLLIVYRLFDSQWHSYRLTGCETVFHSGTEETIAALEKRVRDGLEYDKNR